MGEGESKLKDVIDDDEAEESDGSAGPVELADPNEDEPVQSERATR